MRLVSRIRTRVRNGELSERGLARVTGVSQPHIHNVLNGSRMLSAALADQILERLRIDLIELLPAHEAGATWPESPEDAGKYRMVAMLEGWIGREYPYPHASGPERYPFPWADVQRLESPVVARLAPDPLRASIFAGGGLVLLDRSEKVRRDPDEEAYFALDLSGSGTIGLVRHAGRRLCLWLRHADAWQAIPLPDRDPLDVIRGRVSLVVLQV